MPVDVGSAVGYLDLDINGFLKGLDKAQAEADAAANKITASASKKLQSAGSAMTSAGKTLTASVTLPIVGLGTAIVTASSKFEAGMSKVKAVSGATGDEFKQLENKAKELGATTVYSASQVADGMSELAKAGWNSQQIMAGMEGVLNAATASGEELAAVSTIVADAITGFGLAAEDATRVADLLTQAANAGTIDITDLGESFKYIAPIAKTMGFSIEDAVTAITAMSTAGIKGSQAGTGLRTMFTRMVKPTDDVAKAMQDLNLVLTESDGSFKSMDTILADMRGKFAGMTDEQKTYYATLLAGQEGMSAMLSILNMTQEEYDAIAASMDNAGGVAKTTAEIMQDNLQGQIKELQSALEGLSIELGEILLPYLKKFVEKVQELTEWFSNLSVEQKDQVVKLAAIAAAAGPVLFVFGKFVSLLGSIVKVVGKVPAAFAKVSGAFSAVAGWFRAIPSAVNVARSGFAGLAAESLGLGRAFTLLGGPIGWIIFIVTTLASAFVHLWQTNEDFRNKVLEIWSNVQNSFNEFTQGIVERINELGFEFEDITQVISAIWDGFCNLLGPPLLGALQFIQDTLDMVFGIITGLLDIFIGIFTGDWEQAWRGVQEVFSSVWNFIVDTFTNVGSTLQGILDVICGWFGTTWDQTWTNIKQFFVDTWNGILEFFTGIGETISTTFQSFVDGVVSFFSNLPYNIGYALGLVIGTVITWATTLGEQAVQAGSTFFNNLVNFFVQLPGNVATWLNETVNNAVAFAQSIPQQAASAGSGFISNVVTFFSQLPGNVANFLGQAVQQAMTWVSQMGQAGAEAIQGLISAVIDGAAAIPGQMASIGNNIVQGVWNGIQGAIGWFTSSVSGFFSGIVDGAKAALGIASPSKVLADKVGRWIPPGVSVGFAKAMPKATAEMQTALTKGMNSLDAGNIDTGTILNVETLADKLKTVYSSVASWFAEITDNMSDSLAAMTNTLASFISSGALVANAAGGIGYIPYGGVKSQPSGGSKQDGGKTKVNTNGDTFVFNSPKPIDEVEAARQMKKAKRDLAEGF